MAKDIQGTKNYSSTIELNLENRGLRWIPEEVFKMENLVYLNLNNNQIHEIPQEIGNLLHLKDLRIAKNQLTSIPTAIGNLRNLERLHVYDNNLDNLPEELGNLRKLRHISAFRNRLKSIPATTGNLRELGKLNLSSNDLHALPASIGYAKSLTHLDLSRNKIPELPEMIGNLARLEHLDLSSNRLDQLPGTIGKLEQLRSLYVSDNALSTLPTAIGKLSNLTHLHIQGNPLEFPPSEVRIQGTKAIVNFFRTLHTAESERYEAKLLILGEGGVGKSSLARSLKGENFIKGLKTTFGVDVSAIEMPSPEGGGVILKMNIWDFAGQEIEHATHQFFLSEKSIYVLAWNSRHGHLQGRLDYWLQLIQSRAPEAPVLLVATHVDERAPDINFSALKQKYPQLVDQHSIDNRSGQGVEELKRLISEYAIGLPLMGQAWPRSWQEVETDLKAVADHHISLDQFEAICRKRGLPHKYDVGILLETLNNLGAVMHYNDDQELRNLVVLKPNWITKAVSFALKDEATSLSFGRLLHSDLPRIWKEYDKSLHPAFFGLMSKFELAYNIEGVSDQSLIPALLPYEPPSTPIGKMRLEIVYSLSSVPAGIVSRFIVRTHRFTADLHWREGVYLLFDGQYARCELFEHQREFRIAAGGSSPTNFFAILSDTFDQIMASYPGLTVKKLIPCICTPRDYPNGGCRHRFDYDYLVRRVRNDKETVECEITLREVSLHELIYGIHEMSNRRIIESIVATEADRTEEYRQLVLLSQRGIVQRFNQHDSVDIRAPQIFCLTRRTVDLQMGDGREGAYGLHLVCQSPRGWHLANQNARYDVGTFEAGSVLATLLREYLPLIGHIIPVSGADIDLDSRVPEGDEGRHGLDVAFMTAFIKRELKGTDYLELGKALERYYELLTKIDPAKIYGGLRNILAPDGARLWVCSYHKVEYQAATLRSNGSEFDVFLCYNSREKDSVRQIAAYLKRCGVSYWLDEERIVGGDRWQDSLASGLRSSRSTVIFVGRYGWGDWQLEELHVALDQSAGERKHRVIPLLMPGIDSIPDGFPAFLRNRHALKLAALDDESSLGRLIESVRTLR